jgi:hypothetical protein
LPNVALEVDVPSSFIWMLPAASKGDPFLSTSVHGRVSDKPSAAIGFEPAPAAVLTASPFT